MEEELHPGNWAADQLLASLEEQNAVMIQAMGSSSHPVDENFSPNMVPASSNVAKFSKLPVEPPVKKEPSQVQLAAMPNTVKTFFARDPSMGSRGEECSHVDSSTTILPRRPMAQPAFPPIDDSTMSAEPHQSLGRPVLTGASALKPRNSIHSADGLYKAQGALCDSASGVAQSDPHSDSSSLKPRPTQGLAMVDFKPARPKALPKKTSLRPVDLEKWPCRRCHFVHRGGSCETSCLGCGTRNPLKHDLTCPFRHKYRSTKVEPSPIRIGTLSLNDRPTGPTGLPGRLQPISATMELSLECQKRGFNPDFKYYRSKDTSVCYANLWIQGNLVSGNGVAYRGEKEARDALAPRGLELVRRMGFVRVPVKMESLHHQAAPTFAPDAFESSMLENSPLAPAVAQSTRYHSLSSRQPTDQDVQMGGTGLFPSALVKPNLDRRSSFRSAAMAPQAPPAGRQTSVHLPGNIEAHDVQDILESSMGDGRNNISFHLPPNVSTQVAEAYGRGLGAFMAKSQRRARSRSRSPTRIGQLTNRDYRNRERSREYPSQLEVEDYWTHREREEARTRRQHQSYGHRISPHSARPYIDTYRPGPGPSGPRTPQRPMDRLRLTPPTGPGRQLSRAEDRR